MHGAYRALSRFPCGLAPVKTFPQTDDRQRVLDATDMVRLVGEHVSLKPKGREFACLCPFHDDHNPSCYIVPHKQIFHCFVCGAGGNAIDFVMKYHQLGFREALELLANRAGVELTPRTPRPGRGDVTTEPGVSKQEVADAGAFALDFFRTLLRHDSHGAEARATIDRRGLSSDMVTAFELGAAPDRWDGLLQTVEKRGLNTAAFVAAGLLKRRETGGLYDAFRHRWMFPIRDQLGRVVAFGGRKLREEDEPKYLNSSETPIFDKSATCYGLPQATERLRETRRAVVVEGYTDVIACHQAGETNVVATLGTALTPKHARVLRRFCDEVVLVFDGDDAGQRAADRALEVFFSEPVDVRIAVLPGGADPADLLAQPDGTAKWREAIARASDALEFRFSRLRERLAPMSSTARVRAVEEDVAGLRRLGVDRLSPIRRRVVVRRLSQLAGVDEATVQRAFRAGPAPRARESSDLTPPAQRPPEGPAEHLIGLLYSDPSLRAELSEDDRRRVLAACASLDGPAATLAEGVLDSDEASAARLLASLDDAAARATAVAWSQAMDRASDGDADRMKMAARDCLSRLARLTSPPAAKPAGNASDQDRDTDDPFARIQTLRAFGGNPTALAPPGSTG